MMAQNDTLRKMMLDSFEEAVKLLPDKQSQGQETDEDIAKSIERLPHKVNFVVFTVLEISSQDVEELGGIEEAKRSLQDIADRNMAELIVLKNGRILLRRPPRT
jgi:hypothetical protein